MIQLDLGFSSSPKRWKGGRRGRRGVGGGRWVGGEIQGKVDRTGWEKEKERVTMRE